MHVHIYPHIQHIKKKPTKNIFIYTYRYIIATLNVSQAIFSRCFIAEGFQQHKMRTLITEAVKMRPVGQDYNTDTRNTDSQPAKKCTICRSLKYVNMQRQISANSHFNHSIIFHLQKLVSLCKTLLTQLHANELFASTVCCFSSTW